MGSESKRQIIWGLWRVGTSQEMVGVQQGARNKLGCRDGWLLLLGQLQPVLVGQGAWYELAFFCWLGRGG